MPYLDAVFAYLLLLKLDGGTEQQKKEGGISWPESSKDKSQR